MATFDHDFDQRDVSNSFLAMTFPCYHFRQKAFVASTHLLGKCSKRFFICLGFAQTGLVRHVIQVLGFVDVLFWVMGLKPNC